MKSFPTSYFHKQRYLLCVHKIQNEEIPNCILDRLQDNAFTLPEFLIHGTGRLQVQQTSLQVHQNSLKGQLTDSCLSIILFYETFRLTLPALTELMSLCKSLTYLYIVIRDSCNSSDQIDPSPLMS